MAVQLTRRPGKSQVRLVTLAGLFVDESYQRPLIENHVVKLMLEWDERTAEVLTVNERVDGTLTLIDGQHRMVAAERLGYSELPAYIWKGLSQEEEAQLFLRKNMNRRHHTAIGRWKAGKAAGNRLISQLDQILEEYGYRLERVNLATDPRAINCPDTLLRIAAGREHSVPDPDRLRWVLNFTSTVWPGVMFATNAGILAGLDLFHRTYEAEYNLHELKNKLGKISPSLVHQEAMDIAHASKKRRRVAMCYSMAIQRLYDKNRKRKHRLEPDSDRYLD